MDGLHIRHIQSLSELDEYESSWKALESVSDKISLFQSWYWSRAWCEYVLSQRKNSYLDVQVVEDGKENVLAILPFFTSKFAGPAVRIVQFIGHGMSFQNDILLSKPESESMSEKIVSAMLKELGPRSVLHLGNLDEKSVFTKQLLARGVLQPQCSRLSVTADPKIKDQFARLGRASKKNLKKKRNKLGRNYEVVYKVSKGEDFSEAFDIFISLHNKRFQQMNRSTLLKGPSLDFLRNTTTALSHDNQFEIIELQANGSTIACGLFAVDKLRYYWINGGFEPEFGKYSVQLLLLTESLRRAFDELGCKSCDFGPGYQPYKFSWKPQIGYNYFCTIGGRGFYAKLIAFLYNKLYLLNLPKSYDPELKKEVSLNHKNIKTDKI